MNFFKLMRNIWRDPVMVKNEYCPIRYVDGIPFTYIKPKYGEGLYIETGLLEFLPQEATPISVFFTPIHTSIPKKEHMDYEIDKHGFVMARQSILEPQYDNILTFVRKCDD